MAYVTISKEVLIKEETKIPIEEYRKMQGYANEKRNNHPHTQGKPISVTGRGSFQGTKLSPTKVSLESRQSVSFGYKDLSLNSSSHDPTNQQKDRKPSLNVLPTDDPPKRKLVLFPARNLGLATSSSKSINYVGPQEFSMSEGRLEDLQSQSIELPRGKSYEKTVKLSNFSNTQQHQLLMTTGKLQGSLQGSQKFSWGTNRTPKFPKDFKTSPRDKGFDDSDSRRHLNGGSGGDYTSDKMSHDKGASQKISNFYVTFKGYEGSQNEINMKIIPLNTQEGPLSSDNYLSLNRLKTGGPSQETVPSEAKTKPIRFLKVSPSALGAINKKRTPIRTNPLIKRYMTPSIKKHLGDVGDHQKEQPREAPNLQPPLKSQHSYRRFSAASGFNMNVESVDSENMFLIPGPIILDSQSNQQYTILAGISSMLNSADPRVIQGNSSSTKKGNKSKESSNLIKSVLKPKDHPPTPELLNASERSFIPRSVMSIDKDYSKPPSFNNLRSQLGVTPAYTHRSKRSSSKNEENTSGQPSQMFDSRSQHYFQRMQQLGLQEGPINLDTNLDIEGELRKNSALQNYARGLLGAGCTTIQ